MNFLLDGHKLCINTNKTVAMVFNKRLSSINKNIRLFYRETVLSRVDSFKYLGCFLTPNLCEDLEIDRGNLYFKLSFCFYLGNLITLVLMSFIRCLVRFAPLFMVRNYG